MTYSEVLIDVVQGDALQFDADVLAVKDASSSGGLDAVVRRKLKDGGLLQASRSFLAAGQYRLWPGDKISRAGTILMIGTPSVFELHYAQLRDLGTLFLEALWREKLEISHLATTVHGVQTALGLDEIEAFRSLLLGISDAYEAGHYPSTLKRITFVERNEKRALRLKDALQQFLPSGVSRKQPSAVMSGPESFEPEFRQPEADKSTPHIFVAMPFKEDYDDQFYLAIQPSVKEAGFLCERMDLDTFTGDIMERMFERIRSAKLMIALLDGSNPNVYLEVGYAWCAGTPTVLIAHKETPLPFDVRSQRVLIYDRIHKLKDMLAAELRPLVS